LSSLAAGCFTGLSNPRNRRSASTYSRALRGLPDRKVHAATGGANKPPTHQQLKAANHTPYRPNGCGVPTCACTSLTSRLGLTGTPLPSTSRAFKCGVRFSRTVPRFGQTRRGRTNSSLLGSAPLAGRPGGVRDIEQSARLGIPAGPPFRRQADLAGFYVLLRDMRPDPHHGHCRARTPLPRHAHHLTD
jgi:hypothetical protein